MTASLSNARRNLGKSGLSAADFLAVLKVQKLVQLSDQLRNHLADL